MIAPKLMPAARVLAAITAAAGKQQTFFFCLDYSLSNGYFITETDAATLLFNFPGSKRKQLLPPPENYIFTPDLPAYSTYLRQFQLVQSELNQGNSFLSNLTFTVPLTTDMSLDTIFGMTSARYKILVPHHFIAFSPETFIRIDTAGIISTYPMKGTVSGNCPDTLLHDPKETAEHYTIVDLMRNDLNQVADRVRVEKFRYLTRINTAAGTVWQTSSKITGRLPAHYLNDLGAIIRQLLPAGSVTGAPKAATVNILAKAETAPRGFYTGIAGFFDGKSLDTCVLIRYIEEQQGRLYYKSGGGITVHSDPGREYQELISKIYLPMGENNASS